MYTTKAPVIQSKKKNASKKTVSSFPPKTFDIRTDTIQCFNLNGQPLFGPGRVQPTEEDGFGSTTHKGTPNFLQRDHIIPLSLIKNFAQIIFTSNTDVSDIIGGGNTWLQHAGKIYLKNAGRYKRSTFYQENRGQTVPSNGLNYFISSSTVQKNDPFTAPEYLSALEKAITWMPANIMLAPSNKADDPGDKLDTTAKAVVGNNYSVYKSAYDNMLKVVQQGLNPGTAACAIDALKGLSLIADLRRDPWPYNEQNWQIKQGKYRARTT